MRDLTVAAGSGSASPPASVGEAGIMLHQSASLTSSPWHLTDTVDKVVVYRCIQHRHMGGRNGGISFTDDLRGLGNDGPNEKW